ncbi:MAG: hypothetical protein GWP91_09115 [Rhodobacterales bacterium]|nr:hypothetical protein [Rhodobacterales bacterium]
MVADGFTEIRLTNMDCGFDLYVLEETCDPQVCEAGSNRSGTRCEGAQLDVRNNNGWASPGRTMVCAMKY